MIATLPFLKGSYNLYSPKFLQVPNYRFLNFCVHTWPRKTTTDTIAAPFFANPGDQSSCRCIITEDRRIWQ
nr:hypothetical transcript [Hymenolepis microstoma]